MVCPDCDGTKETIASHVSYANGKHGYNVPLKCTRCLGTGEVDDRTPEWIATGKLMRNARLNALRNLREEAKRRGMSAATLSQMELGKIEPVPETP